MSLEKFKLINDYPGSPEIGYTINSGNSMFYSYHPDKYPHLWEKINCDQTITTYDGVELGLGESYYIIRDYEYIVEHQVTEYGIQCDLYNNEKIFSSKEVAEEHLINSISLTLEDGDLYAEDITLYGLCLGSFQLAEISSLKLNKKLHAGKTSGHISDKWKWFMYETNRSEYITFNKPIFSLSYLLGRFVFENIDLENQIIEEARNIINNNI